VWSKQTLQNNSIETDSANGAAKRFRTQMSATQVKALKSCYRYCKTPTLNECESVGLEVGLAKRVVQVGAQLVWSECAEMVFK